MKRNDKKKKKKKVKNLSPWLSTLPLPLPPHRPRDPFFNRRLISKSSSDKTDYGAHGYGYTRIRAGTFSRKGDDRVQEPSGTGNVVVDTGACWLPRSSAQTAARKTADVDDGGLLIYIYKFLFRFFFRRIIIPFPLFIIFAWTPIYVCIHKLLFIE